MPASEPADTDLGTTVNVFGQLSDDTLADVIEEMATLRPLQPIADWRFGSFMQDRDPTVHVRHSLWHAAQARNRDLSAIIPWHGKTRLRLHFDNDLSRTLFAGGCFEPNEFSLLDRVLRPDMVFVDGGANEGVYTVFAASIIGRSGRVFAVEPSERELVRLCYNVALNQLSNVEIVRAALAERCGTVDLSIAEVEHAGQNTLGAAAYPGVAMVDVQPVPAITLDVLAAEQRLTRLDVLKLDVEGAELRALSAASTVLLTMRPLILVEINEGALAHQDGSAAALFALLQQTGYVLLTFGNAGMPVPLSQNESVLSDNIVAVHRERDWALIPGVA